MDIVSLSDHQTYLPQVADWIYREFVENIRNDITLDHIKTTLQKRQKDAIPLTYLGMIEGDCIGTVSLVGNDLKARPDLSPWLAALYVRPDCRGQGYAKQLIQKVIASASGMGYRSLYLRTETTAEYYKRLGWTKVDETVDEFQLFTEVFAKEIYL